MQNDQSLNLSDTVDVPTRNARDPDPLLGATIGDYNILDVIGEGGMGVVYRGRDNLGRTIAIKSIKRSRIQEIGTTALQRFKREAKLLARLKHPRIVTLYAFIEHQGDYYLVMEWVDGKGADQIVNEQNAPLSWQNAAKICCQVCDALKAAHAVNPPIIHRDVKPGNVMLDESLENATLTDFGLSKPHYDETSETCVSAVFSTHVDSPHPSSPTGTPAYMAPEQIQDEEVTARTDVYGLGGLFYFLLTGKPPFSGSTVSILQAHCEAPRPNPLATNSGLPRKCKEIIAKAMAIDPNERYQNVEEAKRALEALLASTKRRLICAGIAASVLIIVGALFAAFSGGTAKEAPKPALEMTEFERFQDAMTRLNPKEFDPKGIVAKTNKSGAVIVLSMDVTGASELSPLQELSQLEQLKLSGMREGLDLSVVQGLKKLDSVWADHVPEDPPITMYQME